MSRNSKRGSYKEEKKKGRSGNTEYFEGTLQLRNFTEEQLNEVIDHIEASECRIAKHIVQKEGVDLYLTSQKFLQQLEKWAKSKYSCITKFSRSLHTRDVRSNKDLYRVTILMIFLKHNLGEVIEYGGEKVKITSLSSKPTGKIISNGKRMFLDIEKLK